MRLHGGAGVIEVVESDDDQLVLEDLLPDGPISPALQKLPPRLASLPRLPQ